MSAASSERVVDPDDPRVADYLRLNDVNLRRTLEAERGLYLAEGELVVARALAAGHRPRSILVAESRLEALDRFTAVDAAVPRFVASDEVVAQITGFHVHRGVLASMHRPPLPSLDEVVAGARRVVILEDLTNHTNVGAVFRSVAALGADAVLVTPRCADPLYRRSVRVSMGTVFQVPWTRVAPWPLAIERLRDLGFTVAGLALSADAVSLDELATAPPARVALVLGTEMAGLGGRTLAACDVVVRIPMAGEVSSLNAAAAAAVAMWSLRPG